MHLLLIVYHAFSGIILPKWMTGDRAMRKRIRTIAFTALAGLFVLAAGFQPVAQAGQSVGDPGNPSGSSVGTPVPASRPSSNNIVAQGGGYSCPDEATASTMLGGTQHKGSGEPCVFSDDIGHHDTTQFAWRECPNGWVCVWIETDPQWLLYNGDDTLLKWAERAESRLLAAYPGETACSMLASLKNGRPNIKGANIDCTSPTATPTAIGSPTVRPTPHPDTSCPNEATASAELGGTQHKGTAEPCVFADDQGAGTTNFAWRYCPAGWVCAWIESGSQWLLYRGDNSVLKWAQRSESRLLLSYPGEDSCTMLRGLKSGRSNIQAANFDCTPTPTPTKTPTAVPTMTNTPVPSACDPRVRPTIHLTSVKTDANTITAQVSVDRTNVRVPNNNLQRVEFKALENASVDIRNVHNRVFTNEREPFWFSPEAGTQNATIIVHRLGTGPFKVVVVLRDNCGDWPTFVGGGAGF